MELIKELLYNSGKPLGEFYAWGHGYWAAFGLPSAALDLIFQAAMALAVSGFIVANSLFIIYYDRKLAALFQVRKGPDRVGPFGLLQTLADTVKLLCKEDITPRGADKAVFNLAPIFVFIPSFAMFLILPFGPGLIAGDINIGLLYAAAVSGLSVIGLLCAGWSSDNKYSLIGGLRSAAQLVSYELPLVIVILTVVLLAGSLKMSDVVAAQSGYRWFVLPNFFGFVLFLIAGNAEINRGPFDLPEAESELVSGFITEYSSMKFAVFFLAEYTNLFIMSAMAAALFLGGWEGPFLPPLLWFLLKTYFVVTILMWVRWTFPRIRVDHLMVFSWKYLLPMALVNLVGTALAMKLVRN